MWASGFVLVELQLLPFHSQTVPARQVEFLLYERLLYLCCVPMMYVCIGHVCLNPKNKNHSVDK